MSTKECCGVIENEGKYYEYNIYDSIHAIDIQSLNIAIESYVRMGINVIVEGHVAIKLRGVYADAPEIIVPQSKPVLSLSNKCRQIIPDNSCGCVPPHSCLYEKILDKYTIPNWDLNNATLAGYANKNRMTVDTYLDGQQFGVIVTLLYNTIKEYFRQICLQDDIRGADRVFTNPELTAC